MLATLAALASLAIWIYLVFARGGFWRLGEEPGPALAEDAPVPCVAVIVPARNESSVIGHSLASLFAQDYPGAVHILVVDDASSDGTAETARRISAGRATVLQAPPLAPGWTGKLWAIANGIEQATPLEPRYFWLTDADIVHAPDSLRGLVARAERRVSTWYR